MYFAITTPAADPTLVSTAEAKAALGIASADTTQDAAVASLVSQASVAVAHYCGVRPAGATPPTLRAETLTQTFRNGDRAGVLVLARRFATAITSVVEDGTTLVSADYELDGSAGFLRRLCDDTYWRWACGKIVVVFTAGFATVPADLKLACLTAIREQWSANERDPLIKSEAVDGVGRQDFWVGGLSKAGGGPFSTEVAEMLAPYRTIAIA